MSSTCIQLCRYGAKSAGTKDTFSLPIVSVLDDVGNTGLSIALSPEDQMLELNLRTATTGVEFSRELLRFGGKSPTRQFTAHLVGHSNCWRPGLQFLTTQYPVCNAI